MAMLRLLCQGGFGRLAMTLTALVVDATLQTKAETFDDTCDKNYGRSEISPVFRLGSGAIGPPYGFSFSLSDDSAEPRRLSETGKVKHNLRIPDLASRRGSGSAEPPGLMRGVKIMSPMLCVGFTCLMMP